MFARSAKMLIEQGNNKFKISVSSTECTWVENERGTGSYSSLAAPIDCWSNCVTVNVRFTQRTPTAQRGTEILSAPVHSDG